MATKTLKLVRGRRVRLTRLDACGRPVYGEDNQVVSKGFITAALTVNTVDTDEINVTNANGERCIYVPAESSVGGYAVEITFCDVDPDLFNIATRQPLVIDDSGDRVGVAVDTAIDTTVGGFALELWAGVVDGAACEDDGGGYLGYFILPFLKGGHVGDLTIQNGEITFTLTGASTRDGNAWGVGPYNDVVTDSDGDPSALWSPLATTVAMWWARTSAAAPEPFVGARPLLDPATEEITALAAVATGMSVAFTPTPADVVAPAWIDFGDGSWDYLSPGAMGATTHVYAAPGTYTARISNNGTWVTQSVTVTA